MSPYDHCEGEIACINRFVFTEYGMLIYIVLGLAAIMVVSYAVGGGRVSKKAMFYTIGAGFAFLAVAFVSFTAFGPAIVAAVPAILAFLAGSVKTSGGKQPPQEKWQEVP